MNLKTDYKDEILKEGETHRTYNIVSDTGEILYSNVHLEKAYTPLREGDDFGAVDINAITKLLNILPVANGGTGATTTEQALLNLGFKDQIVEEGTNDNGTYIKYASGLMICFAQLTYQGQIEYANGNVYYHLFPNWIFPQPFREPKASADYPTVSAGYAEKGNDICWASVRKTTRVKTQPVIYSGQKNTSVEYGFVSLTAIGWWK